MKGGEVLWTAWEEREQNQKAYDIFLFFKVVKMRKKEQTNIKQDGKAHKKEHKYYMKYR